MRFMRKSLAALLSLGLLAPLALAAPTNFAITIGSSTTQVSTTKIQCNWVQFQNNASHNEAIGDSTTTVTTGIVLTAGGSTFYEQPQKAGLYVNLANWYVAGTQNDVLNIVCDVVPN